MCAGLVLGIEAWQNGILYGLSLGLGAVLLIGFVLIGLRLYNEAGHLSVPSLSWAGLLELIGSGKDQVQFEISPIVGRRVNGTAVLRL